MRTYSRRVSAQSAILRLDSFLVGSFSLPFLLIGFAGQLACPAGAGPWQFTHFAGLTHGCVCGMPSKLDFPQFLQRGVRV